MIAKGTEPTDAERLFLETVMSLLSVSKIEIRMNQLPHQMADLVAAKAEKYMRANREAA